MICHKLPCPPNTTSQFPPLQSIVFEMDHALYALFTIAIPGAYEDKGD